jgi:hypothetical protein
MLATPNKPDERYDTGDDPDDDDDGHDEDEKPYAAPAASLRRLPGLTDPVVPPPVRTVSGISGRLRSFAHPERLAEET